MILWVVVRFPTCSQNHLSHGVFWTNTLQLCSPACSHSFMESSSIVPHVPCAFHSHAVSSCTLALGRKGASRESAFLWGYFCFLMLRLRHQEAGPAFVVPCHQFSLGQPAANPLLSPLLTSLSRLALLKVLLNPPWWLPLSDPLSAQWLLLTGVFSSLCIASFQVFWVHDELIP